MWSRWSNGLLRKRVCSIFNGNVSYGGKIQSFDPFLMNLRDYRLEYGEKRKGVGCFSVVVMNQMKRGVSSSSSAGSSNNDSSENGGVKSNGKGKDETISFSEAKKLMRLVNVESLKMELGMGGKEIISYFELLQACERSGIARNQDEAAKFAKVLDDAGVVLLFRDKVYLHPDKVSFSFFNGHFFIVLFSS